MHEFGVNPKTCGEAKIRINPKTSGGAKIKHDYSFASTILLFLKQFVILHKKNPRSKLLRFP
jgi:hypothetical protein